MDLLPTANLRQRWIACIAASLAAHAMATLFIARGGPWRAGTSGDALEVQLAQSRMVAAPVDNASVTASDQTLAATPPMQTRPAFTPKYAAMMSFPATESTPRPWDEARYVAPNLLTRRPAPLKDISIPYPNNASRSGLVTARLTVFIDEDGSVAMISMDQSHLPPEFEAAARRAFDQTRFRPGEIDGTPVKSRMRIEVAFDSSGVDAAQMRRMASIPGKR